MRTVYGVGINDSKTPVNYLEDGVYKRCPYYTAWKSMLMRCYCKPYLRKQKTYKECSVCEEWETFSNFKLWMKDQKWEGLHLDKDIKCKGNKVYSKDTCMFVVRHINNFFEMEKDGMGSGVIGVKYDKARDKYVSDVRNALGTDIRNPRRQDILTSHMDYLKAKVKVGTLYHNVCEDVLVQECLMSRLEEMQYCLDNKVEYKL